MKYFLLFLAVSFSNLACSASPPSTTTSLHQVELNENTLRVHFIDIGGGLGALIETPSGKHILIDGGKKAGSQYETYVEHFVDSETIDYLIVTHADDDHFYNMTRIIEDYYVGEFLNTGYYSKKLFNLKRWPRFIQETLPKLVEEGTLVYSPIRDYVDVGTFESIDDLGTDDMDDDVYIHYLNVDKQPLTRDPDSKRKFSESEQRNNASLVFRIVWHNTSFLFTGDINGRPKKETDNEFIDSEEKELLDRHNQDDVNFGLESTVIQIAHHGSNGSSSLPFLRAVNAEWVLVPAGNAHGHPTKYAMNRIKAVTTDNNKILRTDASGIESYDSDGNDDTYDEFADDSYIFEVTPAGIQKVLRVKTQ